MHALLLFSLISFASVAGQNTAETNIVNAAFEDVAPCPCDLTRDSCDVGCCCDAQCTDNEKQTFDGCIPFLPGGQEAQLQRYKCASEHHQKEDWFPLLCVVFEYNAFLGYYYEWQFKLANNTQTFLNRLNTVSYYWYREQESRTITDPVTGGYRYGVSVQTKKEATTDSNERRGTLVLPQLSVTGQCLDYAPVRYLTDLDHSCTYTVTDALCSDISVLSVLHYVQSSSLTGTTYFSVLEESTGITVAETNVVYKCADAAYLASYLKSSQTLSDVTDPTQISSPLVDENCVGGCGEDLCVDLYTPDTSTPAAVAPDCSSQNPSVPVLNSTTCSNSVIDVSYTIIWQGSKIERLDAVIVLADIPLDSILSQKYKVEYVHNVTSASDSATDNFYNITDAPYERSGKLGYDKGKEMFSGSIVRNMSVSPPQFQFVSMNATRQMAVFEPGVDGLCASAGRRAIRFGEDVTSACKLQLDITNFTDCTGLRNYLIYYLNSLMPSDVLGRRGYNDMFNSAYWVDVLREDLTSACTLSEQFPLGLSPVDNRTGVCFNMTSGITLDVMYAETGQSNGYPIYEILGSRVSFTNGTWQLRCSSTAGGACTGTSTQPFYLTSSVKFIQIPPQIPEPVSKYYEIPREEDKELCPGARCWDDLFFPFTNRYKADTKEYVFGMVSIAIIFFVGYGLVTRPWW